MPDDWRKFYMSDDEAFDDMPDTEEMYLLWDKASAGIDGGDLMPLAAYIRAGGVVSGSLAEELALYIELSSGPVTLRRGPSAATQAQKRDHRFRLGAAAFVWIRRAPRAHQARIFECIGKAQGAKAGQVEAAYKEFRSMWLEDKNMLVLFPFWRDALKEYCRERGLSFQAEAFGIIEGEN